MNKMKAKKLLCLAILAGILVLAIAVPVMAADTPMWIQRVRLAYTGRSSSGPDAVVAFIHIRDATPAERV